MTLTLTPIKSIKGSQTRFPTCFDDCIATITKLLGTNFELMYIASWDFNYIPSHPYVNNILERICISEDNQLDSLEKYNGISVSFKDITNNYELLQFIRENIALELPSLIHFDAYYASWDPLYLKKHNLHYCIVIGLDLVKGEVELLDPYFEKNVKVSLETLYDASKFYVNVHKSSKKIELNDILKDISERVSSKNISKNIRLFAEDLKVANITGKIKVGNMDDFHDPDNNIHSTLSKIILIRKKTSVLFGFINKTFSGEVFRNLEELFDEIALNWEIISSMIYKSFIKSNFEEIALKLFDKITHVAMLEERAEKLIVELSYHDNLSVDEYLSNLSIKNITSKYSGVEIELIQKNSVISQSELNLEPYYNNQAFGSIDSEADFTGSGEFFLIENPTTIQESIRSFNLARFRLPNLIGLSNDNISCQGQIIDVPIGIYNGIWLLGCSEWGDTISEVGVQYADNRVDQIDIKLTDWAWDPKYGERKVLSNVVHRRNKLDFGKNDSNIFAVYFSIESGEVSHIILPYFPNMHIFSITLTSLTTDC